MGDEAPPWRWEYAQPPRFALVDRYRGVDPALWGLCADVDGLYAYPEPARRDRMTLRGCAPQGVLAEAVDQPRPTRLGALLLTTVPETATGMWGLCNVLVLGHRVHEADPSLVDIMIEAAAEDDPDWAAPPSGATLAVVTRDGITSSITGVDGLCAPPQPAPPRPLRLLECQLRGPVLAGPIDLVHLNSRGEPAGGYQLSLDDAEVRPSTAGGGLVDITLRGNTRESPHPSAEAIWRMWFDGGPDVPNLWAPLDTATREEWLAAAAGHIAHSPDSLTGGTYRLDGRYVTDSPGFFCALGEAVKGPGGYYGDCLFWLHDFATSGGHGPRAPFTLVWHDADIGRGHLALEAERDLHAPDLFTLVVDQLRGDGVQVVLD